MCLQDGSDPRPHPGKGSKLSSKARKEKRARKGKEE